MTEFRQIDDNFFVAGQLDEADYQAAKDAGFTYIINNRPDGEDPACLQHDDAIALAESLALPYQHVPITPGSVSPEQVEAMRAVINEAEGPVLAYCRSGMRSSMLWAMASSGKLSVDDIVARAGQAGYDLTSIRHILDMLAQHNHQPDS